MGPARTTQSDSKETAAKGQMGPSSQSATWGSESPSAVSSVLALQQTHGNRFVRQTLAASLHASAVDSDSRIQPVSNKASDTPLVRTIHPHQPALSASRLQPKLDVSQPGDRYEQEADQVADEIMRMPEPRAARDTSIPVPAQRISLQRACANCEDELSRQEMEEEKELAFRAKDSSWDRPDVAPDVEARIQNLRGGGQPLSTSARSFFEPRFGYDFSAVRVHADAHAGQLARSVNARAFTLGSDIVFGQGEYAPETTTGKRLLAHELTHVVQQVGETSVHRISPQMQEETPGAGDVGDLTNPLLQRTCGAPAIGAPAGCTPDTTDPGGELVLFNINCDDFSSGAEQAKIEAFADSMLSTDRVKVHGFASTDGDATFNSNLSCARALRATGVLTGRGITASQIEILRHGATPGPARERRSVILEMDPAVSRPVVPQLSVSVDTGPDPGVCGGMNFVIHWELSRNSAANGGFVIQDITFLWDVVDCDGLPVPNPDPRTSPLRYFESWRVLPTSRTFDAADGNTDTWFWPDAAPWAGGCTDGEVTITSTAQYHDDVAALPAHMVRNNAATFAGGLRSSLTDPALGGNVSRSVARRLRFNWTCCPCSSSATVLDEVAP
jgi:Domain of unknown function (DUF4157)